MFMLIYTNRRTKHLRTYLVEKIGVHVEEKRNHSQLETKKRNNKESKTGKGKTNSEFGCVNGSPQIIHLHKGVIPLSITVCSKLLFESN